MKKTLRPFPTLLALSAAAAFGGFAATGLNDLFQKPAQAAPNAAAAVPTVAALPTAVDGQVLPSLAPMLKRVTPAVVSVYSRQTVRVASPLGPFGDDPVFRRILGIPDMPRERVERALGSGVIVDATRGYVLTNHHVVENADGVSVTLNDGRQVEAEFIGSDPDTDVALIRIPTQGLTAVPMANSDQLQVGDFVVAMGNPYGLGQTVTSGIVSAVGRSGIPVAGYQNFIQTDASINPGNSGGPLVDLRGNLVGINSMIFSPSGGNVGIGFAIPSDLVAQVMRQLVEFGTVKRGALGVEVQDITPDLARLLNLGDARGAVVARVRSGSPASRAGLVAGDTILSLDGKPVRGAQELHNLEGLTPTGSKVTLGVLRDGKPLTLTTTLEAPTVRSVTGESLDPRLAGAQIADQADSQRQALGGVAVTRVTEGSRAYANGLRSGDLIAAVNQRDIGGVDDLEQVLQRRTRQLLLTVVRGQNAFFLLVE